MFFSRQHTRVTAIRYNSGGNSNGDPPLPIPNREVKPVHAYDTAIPSGKVGSRQLQKPQHENAGAFLLAASRPFLRHYRGGQLPPVAALRALLHVLRCFHPAHFVSTPQGVCGLLGRALRAWLPRTLSHTLPFALQDNCLIINKMMMRT